MHEVVLEKVLALSALELSETKERGNICKLFFVFVKLDSRMQDRERERKRKRLTPTQDQRPCNAK